MTKSKQLRTRNRRVKNIRRTRRGGTKKSTDRTESPRSPKSSKSGSVDRRLVTVEDGLEKFALQIAALSLTVNEKNTSIQKELVRYKEEMEERSRLAKSQILIIEQKSAELDRWGKGLSSALDFMRVLQDDADGDKGNWVRKSIDQMVKTKASEIVRAKTLLSQEDIRLPTDFPVPLEPPEPLEQGGPNVTGT